MEDTMGTKEIAEATGLSVTSILSRAAKDLGKYIRNGVETRFTREECASLLKAIQENPSNSLSPEQKERIYSMRVECLTALANDGGKNNILLENNNLQLKGNLKVESKNNNLLKNENTERKDRTATVERTAQYYTNKSNYLPTRAYSKEETRAILKELANLCADRDMRHRLLNIVGLEEAMREYEMYYNRVSSQYLLKA